MPKIWVKEHVCAFTIFPFLLLRFSSILVRPCSISFRKFPFSLGKSLPHISNGGMGKSKYVCLSHVCVCVFVWMALNMCITKTTTTTMMTIKTDIRIISTPINYIVNPWKSNAICEILEQKRHTHIHIRRVKINSLLAVCVWERSGTKAEQRKKCREKKTLQNTTENEHRKEKKMRKDRKRKIAFHNTHI